MFLLEGLRRPWGSAEVATVAERFAWRALFNEASSVRCRCSGTSRLPGRARPAIALINMLGNASGFVAPYVTGWASDEAGDVDTGLWIVGRLMVASGIGALALRDGSAVRAESARGSGQAGSQLAQP
ncbi:hypothetical protein [Streptomyces sp. Inha503]|uniref:hypothetical protein n=1 Tax=Streptomyces sp. Inha503 TaxID=3383314 RepID=UPI00399F8878